MTTKTLLKGGCVLTLGARTPNFDVGDVLIEDDTVAEVGPNLRARGAETVDATDTIVMPGFVDAHRHVWKSLFRNLGEGESSISMGRLGQHYQAQDVYAATHIGLLGAIECGITTVVDFSDIQASHQFSEAVRQAHADSGLRTVLVHAAPGRNQDDDGVALRGFVGREDPAHALTTIAAGLDGSGDIDSIADQIELALELGRRVHVHGGELTAGSIAELARRDLLDDRATLVHCRHADEKDLDAIAGSGARLVLTPSSEMAAGFGSPPIQELIDRKIRPGLGVDDERVAPGDIFVQMRALISVQHATYFERKLAGKAGLPNLLTTREVIRSATADGANAAGLGSVTGSIEVGKKADIVVLRTDRPNIAPVNDPIGAVVWGMDTSNLDWVFVGGRPLMRGGAIEADLQRARELAMSAQRRVGESAGLLTGANLAETP